jgi:hypothetical protein
MFAPGVYKPGDPYDPIEAGSIDGTDTEPHDHAVIRALYSRCKPCAET